MHELDDVRGGNARNIIINISSMCMFRKSVIGTNPN